MTIATLTSEQTVNAAPAVGKQALTDRFLLVAGLIGPLFFFIVVIVEGATRPEYNPLHHVVSTLALGPGGWIVNTALGVLGVLLLFFAVGLRRVLYPGTGSTWAPILIAVSGLAFIAEVIFVSDPALGYPPAAADTSTLHGTLHNVLSVVFETPTIVAACIVLARRFAKTPGGRQWVIFSVVTILVVVLLQVLAIQAYLSNDPDSPFGLIQRLQFFTLQGWIAVLAGRLLIGPAFASGLQPGARPR
jgi:hypothetical protein